MLGIQLDRTMVRGDTFYLPIRLIRGGEQYVFTENDTVIFRLWDPYKDTVLIEKRCTDFPGGVIRIKLEPEETKILAFKKYKYEVEWTNPSGDVFTLLYDSVMDIRPESKEKVVI